MFVGMLWSRCTESDWQDDGNLKFFDDNQGSNSFVFVKVCNHCQFSVCNVKFDSKV